MDIRRFFKDKSKLSAQNDQGKDGGEGSAPGVPEDSPRSEEQPGTSYKVAETRNEEQPSTSARLAAIAIREERGNVLRTPTGSSYAPDDLGVQVPAQPTLSKFPVCLFKGQKRSFVSAWYNGRDWLEYSVKADAAFCFPCRKFGSADSVFTNMGFCHWKHAIERERGLKKHAASKEHMENMTRWKEREKRANTHIY